MTPDPTGRVLLLVGHATGGIGAHVAALARALPAAGWQPIVATSRITAERFDLGPAVLPVWPDPRRLRAAMRAVDVVHAHGHQAGTLAVALAATLPAAPPVAVSWHNAVLAGGPRGLALGLLERLQARRAALLTGASSDLVARAVALGAAGAELAPVAVDPPDRVVAGAAGWAGDRVSGRRELNAELGLAAGAPVLLAVARIAPQKDLDLLVDAAVELSRRRPAPVWLVAGDGDPALLAALRERAAAGGADVRFLGRRDDVPRLLTVVDGFVLTSRWEARSLAVQEAMAAGLPIVVTRVGGLPDLVGDAALTVPPGEPAALAAAVSRLCSDPSLARDLGARARARFAGLPTHAQVLADWAARYARLAGRADPGPAIPEPDHC